MRPKTDRNESSWLKSTISKALDRSSSATPEGAGDRRPAPGRKYSALADGRDVQPKGPGRGERSSAGAEPKSPGVPPGACPAPGGEASAQSSSEELEEARQCFSRRREEGPGEGDLRLGRFFERLSVPSLDERRRRLSEREAS